MRSPKLIAVALIAFVGTTGCALIINHIEKARFAEKMNAKVGVSTKDDFVVKNGAPTQCTGLTDGREACEWLRTGIAGDSSGSYGNVQNGNGQYYGGSSQFGSYEHRLIVTFDAQHIMRAWHYRGTAGAMGSDE